MEKAQHRAWDTSSRKGPKICRPVVQPSSFEQSSVAGVQ